MNDRLPSGVTGLLLPPLPPKGRNYSLENLMNNFIDSSNASGGAKDFLRSAGPSRAKTDEHTLRLIAVEGSFLKPQMYTEEIRRRVPEEWSLPSFEDVLRIFPLVSFSFFDSRVTAIIFLHNPVNKMVLGITKDSGRLVVSAHKVEPRKKGFLFCETLAFVFRTDQI